MFLGHLAVALAGKRAAPSVSLGTWVASVQFVDLLWPLFLLSGMEHVRIAPGITAFTPLDFYDYPITHSLVGCAGWAGLFAGSWLAARRSPRVAAGLLAMGVASHWLLDVISHRADVPILPGGPYVGLGLWHSIGATLLVELLMFGIGVSLYVRGGRVVRPSFWVFVVFLLIVYFAAAFGPPPPDARALAWSALAVWLLVPAAWWVDRVDRRVAGPARDNA